MIQSILCFLLGQLVLGALADLVFLSVLLVQIALLVPVAPYHLFVLSPLEIQVIHLVQEHHCDQMDLCIREEVTSKRWHNNNT